jgi:AcrR family transcriptional regulator
MFTDNVKPLDSPRKRGRPAGRTAQGDAARKRLYETAVSLIGERGYEATTLRDVADRAGVSVGLLYKYFPSKRSLVRALYDELSAEYSRQAAEMRPGKWRDRFMFALETSLHSLGPHRTTLQGLIPVIVAPGEEGLFGESAALSRVRVHGVFRQAVTGATDAPPEKLADAMGRLLYMAHLVVLLLWLLDRSARQRATQGFLALWRQVLPYLAMTLKLRPVRGFVQTADDLFRESLFDDTTAIEG